uniref:AT4G35770 protein n=1 Tax=Arabidopsis thaliana TaxID=3702 RepID=C0Z378_ARATH|nr:AT4G35770 [Arabidopsis thaliana]
MKTIPCFTKSLMHVINYFCRVVRAVKCHLWPQLIFSLLYVCNITSIYIAVIRFRTSGFNVATCTGLHGDHRHCWRIRRLDRE